MSSRRKPRRPGYSEAALAAAPGYVTPSALCDVPDCGWNVAGSRTITLVPRDRSVAHLSVLIRLCNGHVSAPFGELCGLLPGLAEFSDAAGPVAYLGPDDIPNGRTPA